MKTALLNRYKDKLPAGFTVPIMCSLLVSEPKVQLDTCLLSPTRMLLICRTCAVPTPVFLKVPLVLSFTVKYMREATPYVKKGSPVSEIGWETPPPESPRLGGSSADPLSSQSFSFHRDRKSIPLKMCYVTRSMTLADPENR